MRSSRLINRFRLPDLGFTVRFEIILYGFAVSVSRGSLRWIYNRSREAVQWKRKRVHGVLERRVSEIFLNLEF